MDDIDAHKIASPIEQRFLMECHFLEVEEKYGVKIVLQKELHLEGSTYVIYFVRASNPATTTTANGMIIFVVRGSDRSLVECCMVDTHAGGRSAHRRPTEGRMAKRGGLDSIVGKPQRGNWGVVLQGPRRDLEDWKDALPPGGDPWVEIVGVEVVLRSVKIDGLFENKAFSAARQILREVSGAITAMAGVRTAITFNELVDFQPNKGKPVRRLAVPHFIGGKNMFKEVMRQLGQGGGLGALIAPTDAQTWVETARADDDLGDALALLGGELDWYDIYKIVECLEHKYGSEHKMLALPWVPKSVKKLKESANWARHRRRAAETISERLTLSIAREQVIELVRLALINNKDHP
jgi:hypothetical protein